MQGLWLEDQKISVRNDIALPALPGEALVKVRLSGICGTDLELMRGYYPFTGVIGHEFVGEIAETSDRSRIGQRVVGEINVGCGQCQNCHSGWETHCATRTVLGILNRNGSHAEYLSLPLKNLVPVPDTVSDEMAVFTEPLAAALQIQQQVKIHPSDRVLLIGAGRLGQLIAQTLQLTGCFLRVSAKHAHQIALLRNWGIHVITADQIEPKDWDIVIEATGSPSGFELARQAVRARGTLVLKSTYASEMRLNLSPLVVDEITLIGSRCGPFEPALRLMANKLVDPTPLISARYPLGQAVEAMQCSQQAEVMKVILER